MAATADVMLTLEAVATYFGPALKNNQLFIEHIYLNTFCKSYIDDPEGIDYWVSKFNRGKSKGEVVAMIITAAQDPVNAGAAQNQFNNSITQTSDGGFILFGGTGGDVVGPAIYRGYNIWLIKTDSNGNEIWSREFDLGGNEWPGGSVFQTSKGDFVLIGRTQAHHVFGHYNDYPESIYYIKVDNDGNVIE
ncbi:MAG: hypothetical protein RBR67_20625 [Desulfobacterium sp.]|nr:hypothetical protein [Desulfobacterium sp.]